MKQQMKVGKTSSKEISLLYTVLNEVEWIHKDFQGVDPQDIDVEDFEVFGKKIRTTNAEVMLGDLLEYLASIHFQRILTNCEVLLDSCADPDLKHVDFNPNIKQGLQLLQQWRDAEPGRLREAKPITLNHADLDLIGCSEFTSQCPECTPGTLVMYRNDAHLLLNTDHCLYCAQRFVYADVQNGVIVEPVETVD